MRQPSIRRHLLVWVLGALGAGALVLVFAAYKLTPRRSRHWIFSVCRWNCCRW